MNPITKTSVSKGFNILEITVGMVVFLLPLLGFHLTPELQLGVGITKVVLKIVSMLLANRPKKESSVENSRSNPRFQ